MRHIAFLIALATSLLGGCDSSPQPPAPASTSAERPTQPARAASAAPAAEPRTLEWDDLMPADFDPGAPFQDINIASLADDDPKARELMAQLRKLWDEAPVVEALDGARIRLPGFAVPLETDGRTATRFLLVPYIGACIHVPPPPLNQTVLVEAPAGARIQGVFDPVWVTGRLTVQRADTELANAGYTLTATEIRPYESKQR
ncbi:MAG: DUF3299 domain-containing protein [Candidatus Contendobacter sp.]|nr:DUF3299 domain-containing protein [Candidatus Contendobacter sp.]MDG4555959.1 DUF3299 domain-containing protein [Candidatus Contendobacter sp.]